MLDSEKKKSMFINENTHYRVKIVREKTHPIKTFISVISYALFIWLLLIGITLVVYVADVKIRSMRGDTSRPKFNAYMVLTGSMLPKIKVRDVVVTKKVDADRLKKGDIITFISSDPRFAGTVITHRIINIYEENNEYRFQTKGDNNNVEDSSLVRDENIIGKVIFRIPKLGYVQVLLATNGGWIFVILIPCLAILSYDILKLIKKLSGTGKKKK